MARPLSYSFNYLQKPGDSFSQPPAPRVFGKDKGESLDSLGDARDKARRYAAKHFGGDTIRVDMDGGYYRFERIAKPQAVSEPPQ